MGKVMRHTLGASLNIRHNLSSSKGPKPLQLKLLTTYIPKTSAFTLAFSTSQRLRTTRASARTFFTFRHYITPSARNSHITIIELNALHTKRQNLFQELDAVIHLLMEAKHWGLRKSRNATSLNSRFKSLDTLKVKIISVTFRRVIRTNHKKASKIWRHENIQLGGCQS